MPQKHSNLEKNPNDLEIPQTIVCMKKGWLYDSTNGNWIKSSNIQKYLRTKLGLPEPVKLPRKGQFVKNKTNSPNWIDNYYGN